MAHQESFIKLKGRIGDLTFYKTKRGYLAREKGGVDAQRIATDPRFQRTRENGAEFGRAASAAKLLRGGLNAIIGQAKDGAMPNRLSKLMLKVVQADAINDRGQRLVLDAETELLQGFEFNHQASLSSVLQIPVSGVINRVSGELEVHLPDFNPSTHLKSPPGASHVQFKALALALNFTTGQQETFLAQSALLPLGNDEVSVALSCELSPGLNDPLFLVFGIEFYQQVNDKIYGLSNGIYNTATILKVLGTS